MGLEEYAMNTRVEHHESQTRTSRKAVEVFAICDDDPARLEVPCRNLPEGRSALLVQFDCASAIDAALKGVIDTLVVDWNESSPERLTALSFLRRERPRVRIYFAMADGDSAPQLQPWESCS
jgi:hypothetical protein